MKWGCLHFNGLNKLNTLLIKSNYFELFIEKDVFDSCRNLNCINISNTRVNQLDKLKLKHADKMTVLCLLGHDVKNVFNFLNQFNNLRIHSF